MGDDARSSGRLPVYLVLDCSGDMLGERREAVRCGVSRLVTQLRAEPQTLRTTWLSIITYASEARQIVPLTALAKFGLPPLDDSGSAALGQALTLVRTCIEAELGAIPQTCSGNWRPLVFLIAFGEPTDLWETAADELKSGNMANLIACAAGSNVNIATLQRVADSVVTQRHAGPACVCQLFNWLMDSVSRVAGSITSGRSPVYLPEPPEEILSTS